MCAFKNYFHKKVQEDLRPPVENHKLPNRDFEPLHDCPELTVSNRWALRPGMYLQASSNALPQ